MSVYAFVVDYPIGLGGDVFLLGWELSSAWALSNKNMDGQCPIQVHLGDRQKSW